MEACVHWLRALFGLRAPNDDGEAAGGPVAAAASVERRDTCAGELAEYCRDRHTRGRAQDDLEDWEWRKGRNPEWTSLTSEELAAINPDPTLLDRMEHERLIEKWKVERHDCETASAVAIAPAVTSDSAKPSGHDANAAELAVYCRSSFDLGRANDEREFKRWKAGYRKRAADFNSAL